MNRDNFYFMIIFIPLSLIAIAGFMVDINWLNIAVTWLTGFILGVILYKLGLKALFYWLFQPVSRTYVIRKGRNYCYHGFKFFIKPRIKSIGVTFHESCKVETKGIQKIFGLGDIDHHENSFRWGWRYFAESDTFHIYEYKYSSGVRNWKPMNIEIPANGNLQLSLPNEYSYGKYLFPYFEQDGEEELGAPHDMRITLAFYS